MRSLLPIVKSLKQTNSRLEKESILENAYNSGFYNLFDVLYYCYNPFFSFGVAEKVVPQSNSESNGGLSFEQFKTTLDSLRNRSLTGNIAKNHLEQIALTVSGELWDEICKPLLLKDIRCGITDTTINKVLKKASKTDKNAEQFLIPSFSCQLAQDGKDEKIIGEKILQQKLDGVRLLTICDKETNEIKQYTRNGKENNNFPHIKDYFRTIMEKLDRSYVFDGEIVGASFQDLMCQFNRKHDVDGSQSRLALFDCLPLDSFMTGLYHCSQQERLDTIGSLVENSGHVFVLPYIKVNFDTDDGYKKFLEYNTTVINDGYEGVMVKDPSAPYKCDRTKYWLKIKPFIEESLTVVDVTEGTGKYENMLGNIVCEGFVDDKQINVSVGSGFTDSQRKDFWENKETIIGMVAEIQADAITQEKNSITWSMRFPRFKGFRGTTCGEKI